MAVKKRQSLSELANVLDLAIGLSENTLLTYARLWQLETWLRHMVYTEYKAKFGDDWQTQIKSGGFKNAQTHDKKLSHMQTPEEMKISYVSFGDLITAISSNWELFSSYLPPQNIWDAKLLEITQIRNRVAHFRTSHRDDLQRTTQLLRDLDEGVWRFCVGFHSYGLYTPPSNDAIDPVIYEFSDLIPYSSSDAPHKARDPYTQGIMEILDISFGVIQRSWVSYNPNDIIAGRAGFLYALHLHARKTFDFNLESFLQSSIAVHEHLAQIMLESDSDILITIPAVLGQAALIDICNVLIDAAKSALQTARVLREKDHGDLETWSKRTNDRIQGLADKWPEHAIGPKNPMAIGYLDSDIKFSIFGV